MTKAKKHPNSQSAKKYNITHMGDQLNAIGGEIMTNEKNPNWVIWGGWFGWVPGTGSEIGCGR